MLLEIPKSEDRAATVAQALADERARARDTVPSVPNTPGTPRRTIRVPDALWDAAQAKAQERGENLSDAIRKALERYVKRGK